MDILFEDDYLLVINKPAGLSTESGAASHPSAETEAMQYHALRMAAQRGAQKFQPKTYLRAVHRLDRASSGVLVFAKSKSALTQLMGQFERKEIKKTYWALVEAAPERPSARLCHFHKKTEDGRKAMVSDRNEAGSQLCELSYQWLKSRDNGQALLEVTPATGKFHQIRAQLAFVGCPIVGDVLYGAKALNAHEIKLHALRLELKHPVSEEVVVFVAEVGW
jgi:23S rRNA pseudouridine1911/1915/1917 synthase